MKDQTNRMHHRCVIHSTTGRVSFDFITDIIPPSSHSPRRSAFVFVCSQNGRKKPWEGGSGHVDGDKERSEEERDESTCIKRCVSCRPSRTSIWTRTCELETLPTDKQRRDGTSLTAALLHCGRNSVGKWILGGKDCQHRGKIGFQTSWRSANTTWLKCQWDFICLNKRVYSRNYLNNMHIIHPLHPGKCLCWCVSWGRWNF